MQTNQTIEWKKNLNYSIQIRNGDSNKSRVIVRVTAVVFV